MYNKLFYKNPRGPVPAVVAVGMAAEPQSLVLLYEKTHHGPQDRVVSCGVVALAVDDEDFFKAAFVAR